MTGGQGRVNVSSETNIIFAECPEDLVKSAIKTYITDNLNPISMAAEIKISKIRTSESCEPAASVDRPIDKPKAAYLLGEESFDLIYPPRIRQCIESLAEFESPPIFSADYEQRKVDLKQVEIIFAGWNMVPLNEEFLESAPKLKAIFYGAGSIRYILTPEFWERDIQITSAYAANSIPVSEYTLGVILLSLKNFWGYSSLAKQGLGWGDHTRPVRGNYMSRVGLVSCGMIARQTIRRLNSFDLMVSVNCPFLSDLGARSLGVSRLTLREIFEDSDVVSLHSPDIPDTRGMIGREHLESMKSGATFINSARGAIVRQNELIEVAKERSDLTFILDVTHPEPPTVDSPLLKLPNIIVTPHIAGSMGPEIGRLGEYMLEELKRYVAGKPLRWRIRREAAEKMA